MGYQQNAKKNFKKADSLSNKNTAGRQDLGISGEKVEPKNLQKEIDTKNKSTSLWAELKQLGTKEGRSSFLRFLQSGYKKM